MKKKLLALSLALVMLIALFPAVISPNAQAEVLTGPMGDSAEGVLDGEFSTRTLTVSGSGPMYDFTKDDTQWYHEERGLIMSLSVEDGITSVGDYAFQRLNSVRHVLLSDTVTSIGNGAFYSCFSLPELNLPESVTSVGDKAFAQCEDLKAIYIPAGVMTLGKDVFDGCESLTEIFYGGTEQQWAGLTESAALPEALKTVHYGSSGIIREGTCGENLTWIQDKTGTLTISGTGDMEDYGWYDEENYETHLPTWNKWNVCRVVIEEGVTGVGAFAFDSCYSLTEVSLPSTLKTINAQAFAFCERLAPPVLPAGLLSIGDHAFWYCEEFETITIPASVKEIGLNPFPKCHNLTKIEVEEGCTACRFDSGVLYSGDGRTLISYLTSKKGIAFTVPDGVKTIGDLAFFAEGQLERVILPEGVTDINVNSFTGMASLKSITLPKSLKNVGTSAFGYCNELTDVWYGGVKEDWEKIAIAEENDPLLRARKHYSDGQEELLTIASGECGKEDGTVTWTLDGLGTLHITGKGQLAAATQIVFGSSYVVTSPWWENRDDIRRIVIDEGITYLPFRIFQDCENLESVVIPITMISVGIDQWAFYNDRSLTDVYFRGTESQWKLVTIRTAKVPLSAADDKNDLYIKKATVHYEYDENAQPEPPEPESELSVPMVDPEKRTMTLTAKAEQAATAVFAVYEMSGRMLYSEMVSLEAGETRELTFSPEIPQESAALQGDIGAGEESGFLCKVFLVGQEEQKPLCASRGAIID